MILSNIKMELQINTKAVIPDQDLEGKLAWIAKITQVFSCDSQGKRVEGTVDMAKYVRVQIMNKSFWGSSSGQIYSTADYKRFQGAYDVKGADDLMGKPVVSVYQMPGPMLTGLIPLNMDR